MVISFVFSSNQKPFVNCTRVTEELHSFLSQSEFSNFFVYLIRVRIVYKSWSSLVVSSIKSSVQKTSSPMHRLLGPGRFYKKDENLFVSFSDNVLPWHSPLKHSSTCKVFKMVTQGSQRLEPVHFNCKAHNALSAKKQIRGYHEK